MVVVRNKRPQKPDGNPHRAAKILHIPGLYSLDGEAYESQADQLTCLITSTDDGLVWTIGPTLAHFLAKASEFHDGRCGADGGERLTQDGGGPLSD